MTLAELALGAILSVSGATADERLVELAADIALAVELGRVSFDGPAAREASVLALVAIAAHEAGPKFDERVATCLRRGDLGISRAGSISLWQLLGPFSRAGESVETVCANQSLAALLALRVLDIHSDNCPRGPWLSAFEGYAGGRCGRHYPAAARVCNGWARLAARAGLEASCWNRAPIVFASEGGTTLSKLPASRGDTSSDLTAARCTTFDRLLRANRLQGECYRASPFTPTKD